MVKKEKIYPKISVRIDMQLGSDWQKESALGFIKSMCTVFKAQYNGRRFVWPYGHKENKCKIKIVTDDESIDF